jgi:dipeptidyl-peptidase-4
MLTQQGYIVASVDNRGTPSPRGREFRKAIYRKFGEVSSRDQSNAVKAMLAKMPYIDASRIGIWGWSGGGVATLNAMFRYPDIYKVRNGSCSFARRPLLRHNLYRALHGPAKG